jgi:hypothetical protein
MGVLVTVFLTEMFLIFVVHGKSIYICPVCEEKEMLNKSGDGGEQPELMAT